MEWLEFRIFFSLFVVLLALLINSKIRFCLASALLGILDVYIQKAFSKGAKVAMGYLYNFSSKHLPTVRI